MQQLFNLPSNECPLCSLHQSSRFRRHNVKAGVCGAWATWNMQYQHVHFITTHFSSLGDTGSISSIESKAISNFQPVCQRDSQTKKPSNWASKHQGALFSFDSQRGNSVWKIQLCNIASQVSSPSWLSQGQKKLPKNNRSSLFNSGTYARSCTLWQSQFPFTIRLHKLNATGLKK